MELRAFAEMILFGTDLTAKLGPGSEDGSTMVFSDLKPGCAITPPPAPGRPRDLAFKPRRSSGSPGFPTARELEDPMKRGLVLHFFANHELLAMELMALALLRFPDAPPGFRMGIAQTILEEQKHMRLYMSRMEQLGMDFGAVPVNRFFWDCLADMRSPVDYVTGMSMTFEQANLDYSLHYRDLFAKLGDVETATILDVVYREEIGHVKHGVTWFNRWRSDEASDWDAYCKALTLPLTPNRAKGIGYDRQARRQAGLSEAFIEELYVYKHSKGRPPTVYVFNPGCEIAAFDKREVPLSRALKEIERDLASLMQFVASSNDVVLVPRKPTTPYLAQLQDAGFPIPQFVETVRELEGRLISRIEPWGRTPQWNARFERERLSRLQQDLPPFEPRLYSKTWSVACLEELEPSSVTGQVARDLATALHLIAQHFAQSATPLAAKAPYGASGRGMQRIERATLDEKQHRWLDNLITRQGAVIIEPWLDRVLDLSVQIEVGDKVVDPVLGVTRFLTDARGQYLGHKLGRKYDDLPRPLLRALHEGQMLARLEAIARAVATRLQQAGFVGVAGIDAMVYRENDAYQLKPIVEINPRYTMGRIAWELDRRILHTTLAQWRHLSLRQVVALGYKDFVSFAETGIARYPIVRQETSGLLIDGFVPTTDPTQAGSFMTVLLIGQATEMLAPLCESVPPWS